MVNVAGVVLAFDPEDARTTATPTALLLLDDLPLIAHAALALRESGVCASVVVVVPPGATGERRALLASVLSGPDVVLLDGDTSPAGSLRRGLAALDPSVRVVLLHDACRPLAPAGLALAVLAAVRDGTPAAVPVLEVTETVKELDPAGRVTRTVPRETLVRVQTPWAVRRSELASGELPRPDGAGVVTVAGADDAFPVRSGADLDLAAAVLAGRRTGAADPAGAAVAQPVR